MNHQLPEEKKSELETFNQSNLTNQHSTTTKKNSRNNKITPDLLADFTWDEYFKEIDELVEVLDENKHTPLPGERPYSKYFSF